MRLALKVDVDTLRGTREGVPKLVTLPDPPADASPSTRKLDVVLDGTGGADFTLESSVQGAHAVTWRERYHAEGTRRERAIRDFAARAADGTLTLDDLTGGTFTITNGGVFGSLMSTPILNPPQVGILGLHKIQERAVPLNGQVVIRPMMYLALSYDHRLVDGREAVQFLVRVKELVEDPGSLLLVN